MVKNYSFHLYKSNDIRYEKPDDAKERLKTYTFNRQYRIYKKDSKTSEEKQYEILTN